MAYAEFYHLRQVLPTVGITLALVCATVWGRADYEPWPNSCESLSPGNDIPPQSTECPFKLTVDDQETTCDGVIYVTIKGPEPQEFAGYMVQARSPEGKAVGKFMAGDDIKLMDCFDDTENTAININYLPKEEVIIRWKPMGYMGTVIMNASVARDYLEQEYWLNLTTKPITCTKAKYT